MRKDMREEREMEKMNLIYLILFVNVNVFTNI